MKRSMIGMAVAIALVRTTFGQTASMGPETGVYTGNTRG